MSLQIVNNNVQQIVHLHVERHYVINMGQNPTGVNEDSTFKRLLKMITTAGSILLGGYKVVEFIRNIFM